MASGSPPILADPLLRWFAPVAFVLGVVIITDVNERLLPMPVVAVLLAGLALWLLLRRSPRLLVTVPLVAAFLPGATAGFIGALLGLFFLAAFVLWRRALRPLDGIDFAFLATFAWTIVTWLANLGVETDAWSLPVYVLTFWAPWIILVVGRADAWTPGEAEVLRRLWLALVVVQLVPGLLKPIVAGPAAAYLVPFLPLELVGVRMPGREAVVLAADSTSGTMVSAHHLGVILVVAVAYLLGWWWLARRREPFWAALLLLALLAMTDAKHVLLAAFAVGVPMALALTWRMLEVPARRAIVVAALALVLGAAIQGRQAVLDLAEAGLWRPLVGLAGFNPKVQLVTRTAERMSESGVRAWIGFGAGAYASRAASSRASDALFKEEARLPAVIPSHTPPTYGAVVSDLYTAEIATTTRFRSGMLTNPFSSLVGIVGEHGLLGTALMAVFFVLLVRAGVARWRAVASAPEWRAAGAALAFAIPFLAVLAVFDSYFEQPSVALPIALLALLVLVAPTTRPAA